jgi:uncharacterized damage-inducible protein DinB
MDFELLQRNAIRFVKFAPTGPFLPNFLTKFGKIPTMMVERMKWTERKFSFGIPPGWMPNTIERLIGIAPRLRDLANSISEDQAQIRFDNKWSIKEHIGHLSDLEELWIQRVKDFTEKRTVLTAADMSNAATEKADHSSRSMQELLQVFLSKRNQYIAMLRKMDTETQEFQSLHPRLQIQVRMVDMAFFAAEHDDHHLTTIREIIENRKANTR